MNSRTRSILPPHAQRPQRRRSIRRIAGVIAVLLAATSAAGQDSTRATTDDQRCLNCHGQPRIATLTPEQRLSMVSTLLDAETPAPAPAPVEPLKGDEPAQRPGLLVNQDELKLGPHGANRCVDCHEDAAKLPHAPKLNRATCATACHTKASEAYLTGSHQAALERGDALAPTCVSCHGGHEMHRVSDRDAPQHKLNSLFLCGDCHRKHRPSERDGDPTGRIDDYLDSTHARATTKGGLAIAATCVSCHGAHEALPSKDPRSFVNRANVPETCGKCHIGVLEEYAMSVHGKKHAQENLNAAVCTDCHTAHQISQVDSSGFLLDVINECGRCHDSPDARAGRAGSYYQTYAESYHGQVTRLGTTRAARFADCHGSHDIRPLDDPESRVSGQKLIETCAKCHPGSNAQFVKFDPHANHRDAKNYPILHGVWLYFMIMMSSVFTFFGVHTILWFVRSCFSRRHAPAAHHHKQETAIRRFGTMDRINHLLVALTFFGLTYTGIPLVFADRGWARVMADLVGGAGAAGLWHRFFAILLIINLGLHFFHLLRNFIHRRNTAKEWLFGPESLVPRVKDASDCIGMFRWFFGAGKRPRFDRWTYWEKFDYWAEVGGSLIIGGSGLLLWFPELFSRLLPGWIFNVAMIVHGYEALLAIGFIFTIHFFNAHLRPGTFPVDEVIFTGTLPEEELKEQRPEEYNRLVASGRLEALRVKAPDPARRPVILLTAIVSVAFGLVLLGFIIAGGLL
ncbi:MAG: hypothetical protein L6Q35_10220 [Phycisphaerales bacterium]|nr:hypothetical protein [Phycisphaerales bacterium]